MIWSTLLTVALVEGFVIDVLVTLLTPALSVLLQMTAKFLVSNYLRTHKARLPLAIYFIIIILMVIVIMVVTGLPFVCTVPAPAWAMVVVRTPRLDVTTESLRAATWERPRTPWSSPSSGPATQSRESPRPWPLSGSPWSQPGGVF